MAGNNKKLYEDLGYIKSKVEKIDCLDKKIDILDTRMDKMENKMNWMYGWAAGVAAAVSIVFTYLKSKIFR